MKDLEFLQCDICKKVLLKIKDTAPATICCGQPMTVLVPNSSDAAREKHMPVATLEGNTLKVAVGEVAHPMTEEHSINLVAVLFDDGSFAAKELGRNGSPKALFPLGEAKPVAAYAYCNLHGLWKVRL